MGVCCSNTSEAAAVGGNETVTALSSSAAQRGPDDPRTGSQDWDEGIVVSSEAQSHPNEALCQESDWERLGGGELEKSLRDGLVKCVDSRFLVSLSEGGGRIERMQDLPATAFLGLEDLKKLRIYNEDIEEGGLTGLKTNYEWLPLIILSYAWLARSHPDPHAETLGVLAKALRRLKPHGVIMDFASLPQPQRTKEENQRFKEGLQQFNIFYSHPHTLVFQVTEFPRGYPSARDYDLPAGHVPAKYEHRGWCFAEACISSLGKTPKFLSNLSSLPEWSYRVVGNCTSEHSPPPLSPDMFNEQLATKAFTKKTTDLARVQKLYEDAFKSRICYAKSLMFANAGWRPQEIQSFVQVIEVNELVRSLDLSVNDVREEGMQVLSQVIARKPQLRSLKLANCSLGAAGTRVLAETLRTNTSLTTLNLQSNEMRVRGAQHLAEALKVNRAITALNLGRNYLGDEGARSLSEALKVSTALTTLNLESNDIGAEGVQFLAEALKVNDTLTVLNLRQNKIGARGAGSLVGALSVNTALTVLNLWGNRIGAEVMQSLAKAARRGCEVCCS